MLDKIYKAESSKPLPLPFFWTTVQAGFPSPGEEEWEEGLDLNELLISHPAATFFVRVNGNSMEGAGISSGDILVIDRAKSAIHGKIVVAIINGEFTVKRFLIENERITLAAEHPDYPPIHINPESDFQVWGVVTYVIHKTG